MGGVLLWRAGVSGALAWTLMRPHEDPYFDFDGEGSEPKDQCTVYPAIAPDVGFTPTLQWEGLRGRRLGDLPSILRSLPRLSSGDAAAFVEDVDAARSALPKGKAGAPWES